MPVANNADDYAIPRVGIFFPANDQTSEDGNLTGQCVTLIKWFLAEMTSVPYPFNARGDARYVGKRLVAQGHAVEVPFNERRRGDIITMEYGIYGHIYIQMSGGRVFEENVNIPGVAGRVLADGTKVFAARIGYDSEAWRHDVHAYRVNSYKEGGTMPYPEGQINDNDDIAEIWRGLFFREPSKKELDDNQGLLGKYWNDAIKYMRNTDAFIGVKAEYESVPALKQRIAELEKGGTRLDPGKYIVS